MTKKIRVVFDANPLIRQKTGVGFYTEGLAIALGQLEDLELVGCYFKPRHASFELPSAPNLRFRSTPWLIGVLAKGLRKLGVRLPWEVLFWLKADLLLFPDFTSWPSLFNSPRLLTIHDLTFIDQPQAVRKRNLKYLRRYVPRDARKADLVLTISRFSKQRIIEAFGLPASKVLACPIPPAPAVKAKSPAWLPKKYILFISTIEPRKNVGGLVDAYLYLPQELRSKYSLVLAGAPGWDSDELVARVHHLQKTGEKIIMPGYVDDAERAALYKNATVVVVPSFYEGFGIPVLEAFSYGAPVAASNLSVLKEIGSDAALYFDPNSPQDIKSSLEKILTGAQLQQSMSKKGRAELAKYSWAAVASEVYQAIKKLVD